MKRRNLFFNAWRGIFEDLLSPLLCPFAFYYIQGMTNAFAHEKQIYKKQKSNLGRRKSKLGSVETRLDTHFFFSC